MSKWLKVTLLLLVAVLAALPALAQDEDPNRAKAIFVVENTEPFTEWLETWPDYIPEAWGPDENGVWYVEFYDAAHEEWLGYANINGETYEILDSFAPTPLPADVFQEQMPQVLTVVAHDAEVLAWLGGLPELWEIYADWNRWDQQWEVYHVRGIEQVVAYAVVDEEGDVQITDVVDPNVLDDEEALAEARNAAINLAYSSPGIDTALTGHDNWTTYAQQQGGEDVWGVAFVDGDTTLFFALVDLAQGEVLSTE